MDPSPYSGGRVLFSSGFDPKAGKIQIGGREEQKPVREHHQQKGPGSPLLPLTPGWGELFLHLPLNLTRPDSSSLPPPRSSGILPIIPSLLAVRGTSPTAPKACGEVFPVQQ